MYIAPFFMQTGMSPIRRQGYLPLNTLAHAMGVQ